MDVFLSWSGDRSRDVAQALNEWLPLIRDDLDPWISDSDIRAGGRWLLEIGRRLEQSNFGIICLTQENLQSPWIMFEAGALSKILEEGHVCPYLLDVENTDLLTSPLSQFQAKKIDKRSTLDLLQTINSTADRSIHSDLVLQRFERFWPDFEQKLKTIRAAPAEGRPATRDTDEILEELVEIVRASDRRLGNLEAELDVFGALASQRRHYARMTPTLPPWWAQAIESLRINKKALTATVFQEADTVIFNGTVLWVGFPDDADFHASEARKARHVEALKDVVEAVAVTRPKEVFIEP